MIEIYRFSRHDRSGKYAVHAISSDLATLTDLYCSFASYAAQRDGVVQQHPGLRFTIATKLLRRLFLVQGFLHFHNVYENLLQDSALLRVTDELWSRYFTSNTERHAIRCGRDFFCFQISRSIGESDIEEDKPTSITKLPKIHKSYPANLLHKNSRVHHQRRRPYTRVK